MVFVDVLQKVARHVGPVDTGIDVVRDVVPVVERILVVTVVD